MRTDELYKFSDGTLTSVRSVLHDITSNLRMDYLPKKRWSSLDRKRSRIMIKAIDQLLLERRSYLVENGNSRTYSLITPESGHHNKTLKMTVPSTTEEKICKKNDVKARSLLLMALPNEHQLTFNQYVDAQSMFVAIKARFGGNDATKKTQKALLKQQYENFNATSSESLDSIFNRLQKLKVKRTAAANNDDKNLAFLTTSSPSSTNTINTILSLHDDDLEEMDLKWNMALLSMRARKFYQRTRRKIIIDGSSTAGYDKSKVECFNCHKMGHFARECRAPRSKDNRNWNQGSSSKAVRIEDASEKAMCAIDGAGFDWSDMAEDEIQANMALMAFTDSEVSNDKSCSKSCLQNYEALKKQYDDLLVKLDDTGFKASTYKRGLSILEGQIIKYKESEVLFSEEIALLKRSVGHKEYLMGLLKTELEKVKEEKEGFEFKIAKFEKSSKDLDQLLASQITDKSKKGFGYNVVPSPHPLILNRPTPLDLSYSGLQEFKQPEASENTGIAPIIEDLGVWMMRKEVGLPQNVENPSQYGLVPKVDAQGTCLETLAHLSDFKMNLDGGLCYFWIGGANGEESLVKIENLVDRKFKIIRSDNGTEFKNHVMDKFCREKGIKREYSVARTPQQNGVAERKNRTLIEAARTMLADSKLPTTFWDRSSFYCLLCTQDVSEDDGFDENQVNTASPPVNTGSRDISTATPEVNTANSEGLMGSFPTTEGTKRDKAHRFGESFTSYAVFFHSSYKKFTRIIQMIIISPKGHRAYWLQSGSIENKKDERGIVVHGTKLGLLRRHTQKKVLNILTILIKVYKVVIALYGLHQASRACSTKKGGFVMVFEKLMKDKFQMSSMEKYFLFGGCRSSTHDVNLPTPTDLERPWLMMQLLMLLMNIYIDPEWILDVSYSNHRPDICLQFVHVQQWQSKATAIVHATVDGSSLLHERFYKGDISSWMIKTGDLSPSKLQDFCSTSIMGYATDQICYSFERRFLCFLLIDADESSPYLFYTYIFTYPEPSPTHSHLSTLTFQNIQQPQPVRESEEGSTETDLHTEVKPQLKSSMRRGQCSTAEVHIKYYGRNCYFSRRSAEKEKIGLEEQMDHEEKELKLLRDAEIARTMGRRGKEKGNG
ncbi:ribonuclease H-like domain-containing protein [Tanacetum coccineum]